MTVPGIERSLLQARGSYRVAVVGLSSSEHKPVSFQSCGGSDGLLKWKVNWLGRNIYYKLT